FQTGSNFGTEQSHDYSFLCDIGSGTMISDGLAMINAATSNSSFQLRRVKIGDHNYLGNKIVFPANARTGANCLLGTKVMLPVDRPVRENVGLLGSPCFEIPRVVERDKRIQVSDDERQNLLRKKNRRNLATMALLLGSRWLYTACMLVAVCLALMHVSMHGMAAIFAGLLFVVGFTI